MATRPGVYGSEGPARSCSRLRALAARLLAVRLEECVNRAEPVADAPAAEPHARGRSAGLKFPAERVFAVADDLSGLRLGHDPVKVERLTWNRRHRDRR